MLLVQRYQYVLMVYFVCENKEEKQENRELFDHSQLVSKIISSIPCVQHGQIQLRSQVFLVKTYYLKRWQRRIKCEVDWLVMMLPTACAKRVESFETVQSPSSSTVCVWYRYILCNNRCVSYHRSWLTSISILHGTNHSVTPCKGGGGYVKCL